jgi:hypothetical protein
MIVLGKGKQEWRKQLMQFPHIRIALKNHVNQTQQQRLERRLARWTPVYGISD